MYLKFALVAGLPLGMFAQSAAALPQREIQQATTVPGATTTIITLILVPAGELGDAPPATVSGGGTTVSATPSTVATVFQSGQVADSCLVNAPNFPRSNVCYDSGDWASSVCCPSGSACLPSAVSGNFRPS